MNTTDRKKVIQRGKYNNHLPLQEYEQAVKHPTLVKEEYKPGIGTVLTFSDGLEMVIHPTKDYLACSKFIDRIFQEKTRKHPKINKHNLLQHVA